MWVYIYDENNVYKDKWFCQESPLEKGAFIMPDNCTVQEPNLVPGQHPKFENGVWVNYPDFRLQSAYHKDTGEHLTITELGDIPGDYVLGSEYGKHLETKLLALQKA